MKTVNIKGLLAIVATLFIMTAATFAQDLATLNGTVKDPNGAVIGGATVKITNSRTGFTRTTTTSAEGDYTFAQIPSGQYAVEVSAPNFKASTANVQVAVGGATSYDPQLGLNVTSAVVDVPAGTGGLAEVNTSDQQQSTVVTERQITSLPTLDRNPYALVTTASNVSDSNTGGRGLGVSINGQRAASTNILLDGAENVATFTATLSQTVPQDSVSEFRIITDNFTAEFGRASGGIVNVATRSGTNRFEGSVFEENRNSRFSSNGFNNNANGSPKPLFNRNQFGGTVSGPIKKNKWLFLDSIEFTRVRSSAPVLAWVADPSFIAAANANTKAFFTTYGTLSATPTGLTQTIDPTTTVTDPVTGVKTTIHACPTATTCKFDQVRYTAPVDAGGGTPQNTWSNVARVDWNKSSTTQMNFSWKGFHELNPQGTVFGSPYAGYTQGALSFDQNFQAAGVHNFSSNLLFDGKVTYRRARSSFPTGGKDPNTPTLYWFDGTNPTLNGQCLAMPGYVPCSPGLGLNAPELEQLWDIKPNMTWSHGSHTVRFGAQYVHLNDDVTFGAYQNASEGFASASAFSAATGFLNGTVHAFQVAIDPQGKTPGGTITTPVKAPNFDRTNLYNEWSLYAQDTWKVTRTFTFVPGMRYEYYGPQHSKQGLDSNFYFGTGATIFDRIRSGHAGPASDNGGSLWKANHGFAPRIGFAWDITGDGKNSLRGGYGMAFERNFGNVTFNVIQNPPFYAVLNGGSAPVSINNFGPLGVAGPSATLPRSSLRAVDPNIKLAFAHQWGATFEHQLDRNTVIKFDYSASAGRNLYSIANINRTGTGTFYEGSIATTGCNGLAPTDRLNCQYSNINFRGSDGTSNYYGFTPSLESNNLWGTGAIVTLRYTYGNAKDDLSTTFSETSNAFDLGYVNPFNPMLDYGPADFDIRHRFVGTVVYPFKWKFNDHWANDAFGGWNFSSVFFIESGTPFSIYDENSCNVTVCWRMLNGGQVVQNGKSQVQTAGSPNSFNYLVVTGAPTPPCSATTGLCGDILGNNEVGPYPSSMSSRNTFRGPGQWNADMSLFKNFNLSGEKYKLQIRADGFNVFNHANTFVNGGTAFVCSGCGPDSTNSGIVTTSKFGTRTFQFSAKVFF